MKKGIDGICLLGFIHFDFVPGQQEPAAFPADLIDWRRPTSAPFLLCSDGAPPLKPADYRQIGDLLTFLGETDHIAHPSRNGETVL